MAASMRPPVSFTLPIACQICLGKVKEPVICSNQHVFCNSCMEVWLQHKTHCPTCRVPITPDSPCKQILGGPSCSEDSERRKSTPELRKMRFELLYREYEDEMEHLRNEVTRLRAQNAELSGTKVPMTEPKSQPHHPTSTPSMSPSPTSSGSRSDGRLEDSTNTYGGAAGHSDRRDPLDNITMVTQRLKRTSIAYGKLKVEMERMKRLNTQLSDTSACYLREIGKLKQDLNSKSPRKYEKYALAAQQTKLDKSDQEVKQLKRALERSDLYVEELECKLERYKDLFGDLPLNTSSTHTGRGEAGSREEPTGKDSGKDRFLEEPTSSQEPRSFGDSQDRGRLPLDSNNTEHVMIKFEDDEPAAKKFYSATGSYSSSHHDSLTGVLTGTYVSSDLSAEPSSTTLTSSRKEGTCSSVDGWEPSASRKMAPTTPSTALRGLSVDSGSKDTKMSSIGYLINPARSDDGKGQCFNRLSPRKSPRRQLAFGAESSRPSSIGRTDIKLDNSQDTLGTDAALRPSSSSAGLIPVNVCSMDTNRASSEIPSSSSTSSSQSRNLVDTHNETLSELDYSLTPEFVDCARLMKAAEHRIKQKNSSSSSNSKSRP